MNLDELITRYNRQEGDIEIQLALANHFDCPQQILERLVNSNYLQVSEAARLHVKLAGEIEEGWQEAAETAIYNADLGQDDEIVAELLEFAPIPDFLVSEWMPWKQIQKAVENPYLPVVWRDRLLTRLAEHQTIDARMYAAGCEHTPVPCLEILAGDTNQEIRTLVSVNSNSIETWFEEIQRQRDLATNWYAPPQQLAILAASKWGWVLLALAQNPYTPGDILLKFAIESSFLLDIAKNPLAPTEALDIIAQKSDTYIDKALADHPNASESVLLQLPTDCNQIIVKRSDFANLPHSVLEKLASDREILYLILNNPNAPSFILDKLAHCDKEAIEAELREKYPNAPAETLESLFRSDTDYLTNIAKHPNVLVSTLEKLAQYSDRNHKIGLAIIENKKTPKLLRDKLLIKLGFCSDRTIQEELAKENNKNNNQQLEQFIGNVFVLQNILRDEEINECLKAANNDTDEIEKCLKRSLNESHLQTCLEIAKNTNTESFVLERLANYPNFWYYKIESTHPYSRSISIENPPSFSKNLNKLLNLLQQLRCAVVSNPNTPSNTLASFAYDSGDTVLELLAKNPNTPVNVLAYLSNNPLYLIRIAVAENPSTPLNILLELAEDSNNYVQDIVDKNPNLDVLQRYRVQLNKIREKLIAPDYFLLYVGISDRKIDKPIIKILEYIAQNGDGHAPHQLASGQRTPLLILATLATDKNTEVRKAVAGNWCTSISTSTRQQLAKDPDTEVRKAVASCGNTPSFILEQLAKDINLEVRREVICNRKTTDNVLTDLIKNENFEDLLKKAESNHNFADRDKVLLVIAQHHATFDLILKRLSLIKNRNILLSLAKNPSTPKTILAELANNSDLHIRKNVAENPNTVFLILENFARQKEPFILNAMAANNPNLTDRVIQILIKNKDLNVRSALARNTKINFNQSPNLYSR